MSEFTTEQINGDVLVLEPQEFMEAPVLVNRLREDRTIVVNLNNMEVDEAEKLFDFLSGAVFALDGSVNRIAPSVFIFAPSPVRVSAGSEEDLVYSDNVTGQFISWE